MIFDGKYNTKSPAVKRLMKEAQELAEATEEYFACPLEDNLFEWHFTVRGPSSSEFEDGIYHGRIILPPEYPMKPPNIVLLTPNGRFEIHKKICLSISGHHPETWQPSWSIRTALLALIAFMPTPSNDTIGSLNYGAEERQRLAKTSHRWRCETCGKVADLLISEKSPSNKQNEQQMFSSTNVLNKHGTSGSPDISRDSSISHRLNEGLRKRLIDPQRLSNFIQEENTVLNRQDAFRLFDRISWNIVIIFLLLVISLLIFRRLFLI